MYGTFVGKGLVLLRCTVMALLLDLTFATCFMIVTSMSSLFATSFVSNKLLRFIDGLQHSLLLVTHCFTLQFIDGLHSCTLILRAALAETLLEPT